MKRLSVLLAFGGQSTEHEVSISSARNVYAAIDKMKYDVTLALIDTKGKWWLVNNIESAEGEDHTMQLSVVPGAKSFIVIQTNETIEVDVIFPILHGKLGEDGTIQGLAAMAHIPVVGCGVEASSVCMNKDATKRLVAAVGIPVIPGITIKVGEDVDDAVTRIRTLSSDGPWFVKPARSGSSIGVTKVKTYDTIATVVKDTFKYDDTVIVEPAIAGRELEVAVLGNPPNHLVSGVGEIIAGNEFYDYADKYASDSGSEVILTADMSVDLATEIRSNTHKIYQILGCNGLARLDFRLSEDNVPYLMEVNTIPGFTDISMYPKLWEKEGIGYSELIDRLITSSVE